MATELRERLRRLGLPAGVVVLAVLLFGATRLALLLARALGWTREVGATVIFERMSQLKPWPWKAPLLVVSLGALLLLLGGGVVWVWTAALRRALTRRHIDH